VGAGPDPSGRDGPHAFVDDLAAPEVAASDRHHLERVLRLRPGEPLTLSDGRGRWAPFRWGGQPERSGPVVEVAEPLPPIEVAFALVKGERPEWTVQKLTELGVDVIRPMLTARSVVRWDAKRAAANHERLVRIAREASMQCRRSRLPTVVELAPFADAAALPGACVAAPGAGAGPTLAHPVVLIGPEGGWSPDELGGSLPVVRLGRQVLRAETAAITAGALLVALREGLVGPSHADPS